MVLFQFVTTITIHTSGAAFENKSKSDRDARWCNCSSSVSTGVVFELAGGFRVRLVAKPGQPDVTTLHFDGRKPTPDVRVFVDDRQIELLEPVDEFGYTSVAKSDVTALLNGQGIIAIEDTDNQDDDHASR